MNRGQFLLVMEIAEDLMTIKNSPPRKNAHTHLYSVLEVPPMESMLKNLHLNTALQ